MYSFWQLLGTRQDSKTPGLLHTKDRHTQASPPSCGITSTNESFSTGAAHRPLNTAPCAGKLISPLSLLVISSVVLFTQDLIDVLFRLRLD